MTREFRLKGSERILSVLRQFSATEKVIFGVLSIVLFLTAASMFLRVNATFLVPVPARGGTLTEGVIGLPRLINPVTAISDVDRDLSSLIFAGLLKYENGKLVPDLAKAYKVSDDGLTYTFTLKDDARFHDNTQVTADDVEFTIQNIKDPAIQSPRRVDWKETEVKKTSSNVIEFTLKQPYAPFINNFTVGILPKHIWKDINANQFILSKYNTEPIGAGPYKLSAIYPDNKSIPTSYTLVPFSKYSGGESYISKLNIQFFPNEKAGVDALRTRNIDSLASVSPKEASIIASTTPSANILSTPLPRIFAVFLNQNSAIFTNKEVRQALSQAVDRNLLVKNVLNGYGVAIDGPIPFGIISEAPSTAKVGPTSGTNSAASSTVISEKSKAKLALEKAGWVLNNDGVYQKGPKVDPKTKKSSGTTQILEFTIATADSPDLKQTAEFVKSEWEKIGAKVSIKVFEAGDLTQDIIRNRKYDALLFGEVIGKDLDLYAFWHSSQRNSPGLNLSMYVNAKTDTLLDDARKSADDASRLDKYTQIESIIKDDVPAVFLYSPNFIYIVPDKLHGISLNNITTAWDRWNTVESWYIDTDYVWKIFTDKK